jgi:ribonuclease-3
VAVEHPLRAAVEPDPLSGDGLAAARAALEVELGHRFREAALLARALTHESAAAGARGRGRARSTDRVSNERLEFLGDRVLALVVAELLMERFPEDDEGKLTHRLIALVKGDTLARIGLALGLDRALEVGGRREGRTAADRRNPSLVGNALEAVVGAVHMDGGLEAARGVIARLWGELLAGGPTPPRHPKQALQERVVAAGLPPPSYELAERVGPDHAPSFLVKVAVPGLGEAAGRGGSKRAAEEEAARRLLERLEPGAGG